VTSPSLTNEKHTPDDIQLNAQTSSAIGSVLGSVSSVGTQAMGSAHSLFVPPYSWMWRVGMSLGSVKSDQINKVADVPELLSLITGYYAGSPDAMKAVEMAQKGEDKFSLSSLSQVFTSPVSSKKHVAKKAPAAKVQPKMYPSAQQQKQPNYPNFPNFPKYDESDEDQGPIGTMMNFFGGGGEKQNPLPKNYEQEEEEDTKNDVGFFESMMNPQKKNKKQNKKVQQSVTPMSFMNSFMNPSKKSGSKQESSPTEDMIKMAAPMLGIDPNLANMAAPLIGGLF